MKVFTDKKHIEFFIRTFLTIIIGAGIIALSQAFMTLKDFDKASDDFLNNVSLSLEERSASLKNINDYNDSVNADLTFSLSYLYSAIEYDENSEDDKSDRLWNLSGIIEQAGIEEAYVADSNGDTFFSCYYETFDDGYTHYACNYGEGGENIIEKGIFTAEQFDKLMNDALNGTGAHFDTNRDGTDIAYHCVVISGETEESFRLFITGDNRNLNESLVKQLGKLDSYFDTIVNYDSICAFAIDKRTGKIIYTSNNIEEYLGTNAIDHGIDVNTVKAEGIREKMVIDGKNTYVKLKKYYSPELGSFILATKTAGIDKEMGISIAVTSIVMAVVVLFIFTMGLGLRGSGKKVMTRKLAAVSIVGILLVGISAFYSRTLNDISQAMQQGIRNAEVYEKNLKENAELADAVEDYYENKQVSIFKAIRTCFERNWDLVFIVADPEKTYTYYTNKDGMRVTVNDGYGNPIRSVSDDYVMTNMVSSESEIKIYLINHDGLTIATNTDNWYYGLIPDVDFCYEQDHSRDLNEVLERRSPYYFSRVKAEGDDLVHEMFAIPVDLFTSPGENGITQYHCSLDYNPESDDVKKEYGLLLLVSDETDSFYIDESITTQSTLESMKAAEDAMLCVVSEDEGHDMLYSTSDFKQRFLSDMAFSEGDYEGDNYKFAATNGQKYFASLVKLDNTENTSLLTLLEKNAVYYGRNEVTVASMLVTLLILLFMSLKLVTMEPEEETGSHYDKDGVIDIARGLITFLAIIIVIFAIVVRRTGNETTAFAYAVSQNWEKGFHIFSISYVGYLLLVISVSVYTAKRIMKIAAPSMNSQMETVARLFLSIMQYAGILVIIFYSMYLFGVKTGTVVTSAGIMTIVVGLGANSLIGDIVAGLFIIIEREYKVDDIVTIDNYTGVVKEIGLRTTKLLDSNGNLKTLNNSKINGVLNLTDNYSKTFITASFNQEYTVAQVEKFIEVDLKKSLEGNKKIIEGPWFSGITDLKGGNYTVSIGVRCRQQDQWSVRKDVYKNLMALSREEGVKLS